MKKSSPNSISAPLSVLLLSTPTAAFHCQYVGMNKRYHYRLNVRKHHHQHATVAKNQHAITRSSWVCLNSINRNDDGDDDGVDSNDLWQSELDELTPPSVSFTRNSILFDPKAPTQQNNGPLKFWSNTKSILPSFVTGAWEEGKGDRNPVEHLYNLLFVRLPVVGMGAVYVWNLCKGRGLIMNFGDGTLFEVPPLIVFGIIYVILR